MNKQKLLILAVAVLVALNVATLATIFYKTKYPHSGHAGVRRSVIGPDAEKMSLRFFRKQLQLTPDQVGDFKVANAHFRANIAQLNDSLAQLKCRMLGELDNITPDTVVLNNLSVGIGNAHVAIKTATWRYYLQLKAICSPGQQEMLSNVFRNMLKSGIQLMPPKHGMGRDYGAGRRKPQGTGFDNH